MRIFTVKRLLGALVLISTHVNAEKVLLDAHWKVVKDEKQAQYYFAQPVDLTDGYYKVEVYYKEKNMLFCSTAIADKISVRPSLASNFAGLINVTSTMESPTNRAFVTRKVSSIA